MSRELPPFAPALGRIPSGLYVVSSRTPAGAIGFLASFVQQVGLQPPTLALAVGQERSILDALRAERRFTLSVLDAPSRGLMAAFLKRQPAGKSPFEGLELGHSETGLPYLSGALAWLECELSGEHPLADHVVLFGEVRAGAMLREGEPLVHLRRNGLGY